MKDKTREQLVSENEELRRRVAAMESIEAERSQRDKDLRRSEAKWRSVAENSPLFVSVVDRLGMIQFLNRFRPGFEPATVLGRPIYDFIQPQYYAVARKCLEHVFQTGEGTSYESVGAGSEGSMSDYVTAVGPVIVDGEIIAATLISRDITDRKRAEEELRQSEERYRFLAETVPHPMWRCHANGEVIEFNGRWYEYTGQTPEEAKGNGWMRALHPDDKERVTERSQQAVASGGVYEVEYRLRKRDGSYRWYLARGLPMKDKDGQIIFRFGSAADIDDQKRAQEELVKSKAILQATIDCLPFNFFAIGLDGRYTLQNAVSKAQLRADAIGKLPEEVCPNEHDLAIWLDNNRRASAGEKVEGEVTLSLGGEERFYYNVIAPISDGTEFYGILGVNIDITERKRAEEALKKAHDELEEKVKERTAELTRVNAQLQREVEERRRAEEVLHESEEKYRTLVETSPDAVMMLDLEGHITLASQRAVELYGAERVEELLERNPLEFFVPEDQQRFLANLRRTVDEGVTRDVEYTFLRKDGSRLSGEASAAAIKDVAVKPKGFVAIIRDITERKQAQEALHHAFDQLQTIYDGMVEGLLITDIETKRIRRVNSSFCRMLGYDEEELLEKSIPDLHPPEEVTNDLQRFQAAAEGRVSINEDRPVLRKNGSLFYADITGHRILYEGRPCLLALFRDMTEHKQAEDALERERQSLWRMLQASDHERQTISYEIHDGLAQYLAAAIMQFQARDTLKENAPDKAKKAYETATELVRQAHSESRRLISEVRPPVIDEDGIETAISHLVHEQRQRGGPKIECYSDVQFGRLPAILENALYRIVQEALANACKHSRSKKVTVSMATVHTPRRSDGVS